MVVDVSELRAIMKEENVASEDRILKKVGEMLKEEHDKFMKIIETQKQDMEKLQLENQALQRRMNDMEQYSRRNNIQINNIPLLTNENIPNLLCEIGNKIGVTIDYNSDIQAAHRVPSRTENNKPIIVKFSNRQKRTAFIVAAKKYKLKNADLEATKDLLFSSNNKIYFNDHLTLESKKIFNEARKAVKDKKLSAAWTMNGIIYVKRDVNAQRQEIGDLAALKPFLS